MFKIWKTIMVGAYQSAEAWIKALTSSGFRVSGWAKDILAQIKRFQSPTQVSFVKATLAELGFTKPATLTEIIARIKELGYELCEPDDAPALRLAYTDQSLGEWLYVAMEPVRDSDGDLWVFRLGYVAGGMWLYGRYAGPDGAWDPGGSFLFRSCK